MLQEVITRAKEKSKGYLVTTLDIQFKLVNSENHIVKNVGKWDTMIKNAETSRYADRHLLPKPNGQGNINTAAKYCNYCKKTGHL